MATQSASRRRFLQTTGGSFGAVWLATHWPGIAAAAEHAHAVARGAGDGSFAFLSAAQARDVEAIAAQIVPSGDTPGAREAGVVYFVDQIHTGLFAARARGFLADLAAFQAAFAKEHPEWAQFADLSPSGQLAYLKTVEATPFFGQMRFLTVLGLLSLPAYGGNAKGLGWKIVGFVDQHAWEPPFGHYDRGYAGFESYATKPQP